MPSELYNAEKTELALYIENESALYPQKKAIIANMKAKIESGKYDPELAVIGWRHWVDAGAKRYCKEFGCELILTFPMSVRIAVAADIAREQAEMIKRGEYGSVWPKGGKPPGAAKPRKKSTKKTAKKSTKKGARG